MLLSKDDCHLQINQLLENQTGLCIQSTNEQQIVLGGEIFISCKAKGFVLCDRYPVQIFISLNSNQLPYVVDTGNRIARDYPHRYQDGRLCLETDITIRMHFCDGFSLDEWIKDYVEPYFFSYEFYQRFGEYPFGQRSHGIQGIIESYKDVLHGKDEVSTLSLMRSICKGSYRGHSPCPCGSSLRLRACHGPTIMKFYTDKELNILVQNDYKGIENEIQRYYKQRDQKKAK